MMLLFLVEEGVLTFYYDFREVNIDLGLDVFESIQNLSVGEEYVLRGGAFGDNTIRRVGYTISDGRCVVGDRVYKVMDNGDVDFSSSVCSVDGCDEEVYQDGMCEECWEMWTLKTGAFDLGGE